MIQWYSVEALMAIVAEQSRIMTPVTLSILATGIQAMSEGVVQVVDPTREIISTVTIQAHIPVLVAPRTGGIVGWHDVYVHAFPVIRMNLIRGHAFVMTHCTVI
jgi:hypothetical protein